MGGSGQGFSILERLCLCAQNVPRNSNMRGRPMSTNDGDGGYSSRYFILFLIDLSVASLPRASEGLGKIGLFSLRVANLKHEGGN
jgi:hypothetical protein